DRFDNFYKTHVLGRPTNCSAALVALVLGGVLEKFPRLKIVFFECSAEWILYWMHRMDDDWEWARDFPQISGMLKMAPSEYIKRNCYVTCEATAAGRGRRVRLQGHRAQRAPARRREEGRRADALLVAHAGRPGAARYRLQEPLRRDHQVLARQPDQHPAARAHRDARRPLRVRCARDQLAADRGAGAREAAAEDEFAVRRRSAAAGDHPGARRVHPGSAEPAGLRLQP